MLLLCLMRRQIGLHPLLQRLLLVECLAPVQTVCFFLIKYTCLAISRPRVVRGSVIVAMDGAARVGVVLILLLLQICLFLGVLGHVVVELDHGEPLGDKIFVIWI